MKLDLEPTCRRAPPEAVCMYVCYSSQFRVSRLTCRLQAMLLNCRDHSGKLNDGVPPKGSVLKTSRMAPTKTVACKLLIFGFMLSVNLHCVESFYRPLLSAGRNRNIVFGKELHLPCSSPLSLRATSGQPADPFVTMVV